MPKNNKIKIFFLSLIVFVGILNATFVLAMRPPEIQYPAIPFSGIETPNQFTQKIIDGVYSPEKALPLYAKYFYYLALITAGFIALGAIVYGGFQYLISGGNPVKMVDARQRITSSISGLIILFSSYVILTTINPQLAIFNFGAPTVERCDCSKPVAQLSVYCQTSCQTINLPEETIPTYIEIPIGRIIEKVMLASKEAYDMASSTNYAAEELRKKTKELELETQRCEVCGSIQTTCNGGSCSGGSCRINGGTDCPNKAAIEQKTREQEAAIQELETQRNELIIKTYALLEEKFKLELAESTMRDSLSQPISFEEFISISQARIRKISPWLDINKETDPLKDIPLKDIRSQIARGLPGNDGAEDPATFYIPEKGNKELISIIENLTFSGPILGPPPGQSACPAGTTKPYATCDGSTCKTIDSCGVSSCANDSGCSASPPVCPAGTTRPYTACDGSTCRTIDSCGTNSCADSSNCSPPPPPAGITYENFARTARSFATSPFRKTLEPIDPHHQLYINTDPTEYKTSAYHYGADCGVYVATVIRATIDPNYPKIGTWIQRPYLEANSNFNCFSIRSAAELRAGDILFANDNSHTSIWLEDGEWQASLAEFLPTGPIPNWTPRMNYVCRYKNF